MKTFKTWFMRIVRLLLLGVILYSAYNIGSYYYDRYKAEQIYKDTSNIVDEILVEDSSGNDVDDEDKEEKTGAEKASEIITRLQKRNKDIVSFIELEGTSLKYPVVFRDNYYYLRRDLDGNYSLPGTVFIEERNKPDYSDQNTILYGHNMSNAIGDFAPMFMPVMKFKDQSYVDSKKDHIVTIINKDGIYKYKVFSAYFTHAHYDYRNLNMESGEWIKYLNRMRNESVTNFYFDRDFTSEDKIITLSTCDNVTDDGRFAVHAILVDIIR